MSDNFKKIIIAILILIIAGLGYYSYNENKKHQTIENELVLEKENLISELDELTNNYDEAISKNTMLSDELTTQKNNIISFKDSLKKIKSTNWKLIKFYKKKIKDLNVVSNKLVKLNDSLVKTNNMLNLENQGLTTVNDSLSVNLDTQTSYNNTLVNQNLDLSKKIALAEVVTFSNFSVSTYDERSNGNLKETDKARRVNVFKTSFMLNENPIAKDNNITTYIVIKNQSGDILNNKGTFKSNSGEELKYSNKTTIPYKKVAIASDILTNFGDVKLKKGNYTIDFYTNGKKIGTVEKNLR